MTGSKVHIIYGEVAVGKRPAVRLYCFWWPESHERSLEFFGQSSVSAPAFLTTPSSLCHPPMHTVTQTHMHTCINIRTHNYMRTRTLCHPAQRLGAFAKFLNPPPAFWPVEADFLKTMEWTNLQICQWI